MRIVNESHTARTWAGARDYCSSYGLRLVTVKSREKNNEMIRLLRELNQTYVKLLIVALCDPVSDPWAEERGHALVL